MNCVLCNAIYCGNDVVEWNLKPVCLTWLSIATFRLFYMTSVLSGFSQKGSFISQNFFLAC